MIARFEEILRTLGDAGVEFIVVGGVAAIAHGSSRLTQDVDVVYRRTPENLARLAAALAPRRPYPRGAPPGLPFLWDARTLTQGLNFTLTTELGPLDLLGEIVGGGGYEQLLPGTVTLDVFGQEVRCLDLAALIRAKRAAGRPKDYEVLAELELLFEERRG